MSMKQEYACDICRNSKSRNDLVGLCFSGLTNFRFVIASSTEGVHICNPCIKQLRIEIEKYVTGETK